MSILLQISDPHVVAPGRLVSGLLDTHTLFNHAIDRILQELPRYGAVDAVVVTGDVTDDGAADSYAAFRTEIERLNLPYFLIPGNHDDREALRRAFQDQAHIPADGPINWVEQVGHIRLIGLDTLLHGEGRGLLEPATLAFLEQTLADAPDAPTLIALHHHPFPCGIRFMDALGLEGAEALAALMSARAPKDTRLICGHVHSISIGTVGPVTAISGPSTCSRFDPDFREDAAAGFRTGSGGYLVHAWAGGFRTSHVPLAERDEIHPFAAPG